MPTENEDMFTLQMSKLEIKYRDMSIETVNEIRDKVLGFIDSTDMRVYLNEHFKELDSADLINIIVGAPKPLTTKLKLMNELSTYFPRLIDEIDSFFDFEPYVQLYDVYLDKVLYKVDDFVDRGITPSEFISLTTEVHLEDENG